VRRDNHSRRGERRRKRDWGRRRGRRRRAQVNEVLEVFEGVKEERTLLLIFQEDKSRSRWVMREEGGMVVMHGEEKDRAPHLGEKREQRSMVILARASRHNSLFPK
jgi:hypothetical protein